MKKVLITGHTGGLGKACVKVADEKGWEWVGFSRSTGVDVTKYQQIYSNLLNLGQFDLAIMAHGTQKGIELKDLQPSQYEKLMRENLDSCVYLTSLLAQRHQVKRGGLLCYISSIQATQPRKGRGVYAMAKAGVEALTRIAAVELGEQQIRTVCLRLGQMTHTMKGIDFPEDQVKKIKKFTPLQWVDAEETAKLIFNLYELQSITGETIEITSGHKFSVWPKG